GPMPPSPSLPWHHAHCASKTRRPSAASVDMAGRAGRCDAVRVCATAAAGSSAAAAAAQISEWSSRICGYLGKSGSGFRVQRSAFKVLVLILVLILVLVLVRFSFGVLVPRTER